jgi:hypothetical protein
MCNKENETIMAVGNFQSFKDIYVEGSCCPRMHNDEQLARDRQINRQWQIIYKRSAGGNGNGDRGANCHLYQKVEKGY